MEYFKRKILLEDYTDRNYNSPTYGTVTATSFYVNVMVTQSIDDMGMFTNVIYLPNFVGNNTPVDYTPLLIKLGISGFTFPFMSSPAVASTLTSAAVDIRLTGKTVADYFDFTNAIITGITDSKKQDVRSYNTQNPYRLNFDVNSETYINYKGDIVQGVDRVTYIGSAFTYVFGADKNDSNIGTSAQVNGLVYVDFSGGPTVTNFSFNGEGWNQTNISLSALTKEEYLFGIISTPEVQSDVFIDRGITTIFEKHLKLSEITNLDELSRYGRGFYNLISQ